MKKSDREGAIRLAVIAFEGFFSDYTRKAKKNLVKFRSSNKQLSRIGLYDGYWDNNYRCNRYLGWNLMNVLRKNTAENFVLTLFYEFAFYFFLFSGISMEGYPGSLVISWRN